jgi:NAD(P)-dependent dehydrogenase (short-subunit alcohol dehydrogenase family)
MKNLLVLVGGSAGLGLALLQQYRDQGYQVVEFSRSGESEGHVQVDLSRKELAIDSIDQSLAQLAEQTWGNVILIVNSAQISPLGALSTSEPKQWWQHIDVNFTMPISIIGRFQTHFQDMPASKAIAFISSGLATSVLEGSSLYCGTKAGMEHFVRVVAAEQAAQPHPIKCANLNPGIMDTNMQATLRGTPTEQFSAAQWFQNAHDSGQLVAPSVVAENIFNFLNGEFNSGETYDVAGH